MNKVAIYCRLSDEDKNKKSYKDDSESIQNQKNLLMKYAMEKGWDIYKIYSDDDYSGLDSNRPEFNDMLKDAEEGKFNIILCKTQSRFTRDMELVEKYLHNKFIEWGIRFVTAVDGVDTLDKHNKKSRQINGLVNEWYCEDISESIKAVFRLKQQSGKFIGSFTSYGYEKDPNDKNKLVIDEEAAEVVRMIFNLYLQGNGTQYIARILNEKEIPNPTKYKKNKGLKYKNVSAQDDYGLWNKTTIKRILKNEIYIGNMVQHKRHKLNYKSKKMRDLDDKEWIIVKNTHSAIIDKKTFETVQQRMKLNVRSTGSGKTHIFAGKVKCMDCKSTMNKLCNGKNYVYLRCKLYSIHPKKKLCTSHSIRFDLLQDIVTEKIKNYISTLCDMDKLSFQLLEEHSFNFKIKAMEKQLIKINRDIENRSEALKNIYLDKIKGIISQEQFNEFNTVFLKEKGELNWQNQLMKNKIKELKESQSSIEKYMSIIERYKNFTELTHTMMNELIDYIEIGEKDKKTGEQEIKIYWNF